MFCNKCNFENEGLAKNCMKCGNELEVNVEQPIQDINANENNLTNNNVVNSEPIPDQQVQSPTETKSVQETPPAETMQVNNQPTGSLNYFAFILAVLLKPITKMKEELHKFEDTKTALIFAGIIAGTTTVINLVRTIFSIVYVPSTPGLFGFGATEAHWDWNNLEMLNWGEAIFRNLLLYAGILGAIALVYYLAGLIIKKQPNFKRLLGVASISLIPTVIAVMILSPLIAIIYAPLGIIVSVIGAVYTLVLLIDSVNKELVLEDNDLKIYINVACLSILISSGYYIFMRIFFTISSDLGDLLDLFS